ncbi:hypothetical protein [Burkholderia sp. Bp9143]|uniref:hypothetical protein n=1 Tax=Burkholderia sp. Bp9143 TaxID=2184574 RepID=UPI0021AB25AF|nr:hypothetical protein [Burkholderia sp. Bp9143]
MSLRSGLSTELRGTSARREALAPRVFGTRIACVTEREVGKRADRIGERTSAGSSAMGDGRRGVDVAVVGGKRPTGPTGPTVSDRNRNGERRHRATGGCTQTTTRRAGARQTRGSHVSPTENGFGLSAAVSKDLMKPFIGIQVVSIWR